MVSSAMGKLAPSDNAEMAQAPGAAEQSTVPVPSSDWSMRSTVTKPLTEPVASTVGLCRIAHFVRTWVSEVAPGRRCRIAMLVLGEKTLVVVPDGLTIDETAIGIDMECRRGRLGVRRRGRDQLGHGQCKKLLARRVHPHHHRATMMKVDTDILSIHGPPPLRQRFG